MTPATIGIDYGSGDETVAVIMIDGVVTFWTPLERGKKMPTRDELQKTIDAGQAAQAALDKLIAQEGLTLTDVLDGFAAGKAYRHREWPEGFCVVCSEWQIDAPPPYGAAIISYTLMLCTPCGAPAFDDTITLRGGREKIEASMRCLFAHENGWEEVK